MSSLVSHQLLPHGRYWSSLGGLVRDQTSGILDDWLSGLTARVLCFYQSSLSCLLKSHKTTCNALVRVPFFLYNRCLRWTVPKTGENFVKIMMVRIDCFGVSIPLVHEYWFLGWCLYQVGEPLCDSRPRFTVYKPHGASLEQNVRPRTPARSHVLFVVYVLAGSVQI